jgi:hypothetical protein
MKFCVTDWRCPDCGSNAKTCVRVLEVGCTRRSEQGRLQLVSMVSQPSTEARSGS